MSELLAETSGTGIDGVYRQEDKGDARDLLERILNQNEQAQGIFYLHPDADVRIAVHAVSLLRVSIALRSSEHYRLLQESRCGRLDGAYRNKLRWLTGNLFSRVDTPDWSDHDGGPAEAKEIIDGFVDGSRLARPNTWVPDSWLQAARRKNVELEDLPRDQVFDTLKSHAPPPPHEVIIGRVREVGAKVLAQVGDRPLKSLFERLTGDAAFAMMMADRAALVVRGAFAGAPAFSATLFEFMRSDADIQSTLTAPVMDAIARFQKHRGPRELSTFLGYYADGPLFSDEVIARLRQLAATLHHGDDTEDLDAFEAALRAERPSSTIVGYIRSLAFETMSGSLIERLATRLESDQAVRAALK